jgi:hypothetical protein
VKQPPKETIGEKKNTRRSPERFVVMRKRGKKKSLIKKKKLRIYKLARRATKTQEKINIAAWHIRKRAEKGEGKKVICFQEFPMCITSE